MKNIVLLITIIFMLSCVQEIEIKEILEIQKMDITKAEQYLSKRGWVIGKVKEEKPNASIVDYWEVLENNLKTADVGIGKVNEIIFTKKSSKDSANLILSFRDLKYNNVGQSHKKNQFLNNQKIIRVITKDNHYEKELSNKDYHLIEYNLDRGIYEKIYQKDSIVFWLSTITKNKPVVENLETKINSNTYELIVLNKTFYDAVLKAQKREIEFIEMINRLKKN